jgi:oligopeptidase A
LQGESVFERDQAVAQRTTVMPPLPEDRFLCSFSHIFAGGYAAGWVAAAGWLRVASDGAWLPVQMLGMPCFVGALSRAGAPLG